MQKEVKEGKLMQNTAAKLCEIKRGSETAKNGSLGKIQHPNLIAIK